MKRPVIVVAVLLGGCAGSSDHAADTVTTAVPVGTALVRQDTLSEVLELSGRLTPLPGASADLSAPGDAVVRAIHVQVGERVAAGTALIDLDAPELVMQARSLGAAADAAESDAARQRDLFRQGITARRQLEEREAAAVSARAAAASAQALLSRARVTSPIAGGVQRVLVQPGERVGAGQPLVSIVGGGGLDLIASATPEQLARIGVGQPATLTGEGEVTSRSGRVHAIAPGVDTLTGAGSVVIRIADAGKALRPGAVATARVTLPPLRNALIVPDSAVVLVGGTMTVFVIGADSVAHAHPVQVIGESGRRTAVSGDLSPGSRVVTSGAYGLADGMHVVPVAPHQE
jgi:RND family efflux transporter MFP subunit